MLCDVTLLRRNGMRLRKGELQEPARGMLRVAMDDGRSSFKRPLLVATLQAPKGASRQMLDLLLPLFDASIVSAGDGSMTLQGIELQTLDGRVFEHVQLWRCVPVGG